MNIEVDCSEYLSVVRSGRDKHRLFRGYKSDLLSFTKSPRPDRKPKHMPAAVHRLADNWFLSKFGHRFRSHSAFCTGDDFVASQYGFVYCAYPRNGFTFCWSREVKDLYTKVEIAKIDDMNASEVVDLLEKSMYTSDNLLEALESESEIMVFAQEIYYQRAP